MTCDHQSRDGTRGPFRCALGWYGGSPYLGNCLKCIEAGTNTAEAKAAFDAGQSKAHPPQAPRVSGCCDDARNPAF